MEDQLLTRILTLEEKLLNLADLFEQEIAAGMILSARLDALRRMALDVFEHAGVEPSGYPDLAAMLVASERERCQVMLAAASDTDPNLATALKESIDAMMPGKT